MRVVSLILLSLIVGLSTATTTPKFVFQANYSSFDNAQGVFTSPHGVSGSTSPFVVASNGWLRSYSETGSLLKLYSVGYGSGLQPQITPVMNTDAKKNTLFVITLTKTFNPVAVAAFNAQSLEIQWTYYIKDLCESASCENKAMVYVKPSLASMCPNGAGAVSVLTCTTTDSVANCSLRLLDFHSGALCGAPRYVPNSKELNPDSVIYRSFPADGQLIRPMIVAQNNNAGKLFGIDAVSGMVTYSASSPSNVQGFAAGVSPANDMLAFWTKDKSIYFIDTSSGKTQLNVAMQKFTGYMTNYFGWTPAAGGLGGVSMFTYDEGNNVTVIVSVSATTGDATYQSVLKGNLVPDLYKNCPVNVGNSWTMGMLNGTPFGMLQVVGVINGATQLDVDLSPVSGSSSDNTRFGQLSPFTFADGTAGVASIAWGTEYSGEQGNGFLIVFSL